MFVSSALHFTLGIASREHLNSVCTFRVGGGCRGGRSVGMPLVEDGLEALLCSVVWLCCAYRELNRPSSGGVSCNETDQ